MGGGVSGRGARERKGDTHTSTYRQAPVQHWCVPVGGGWPPVCPPGQPAGPDPRPLCRAAGRSGSGPGRGAVGAAGLAWHVFHGGARARGWPPLLRMMDAALSSARALPDGIGSRISLALAPTESAVAPRNRAGAGGGEPENILGREADGMLLRPAADTPLSACKCPTPVCERLQSIQGALRPTASAAARWSWATPCDARAALGKGPYI
eukprot:scaffold1850_cov357-Prasinococcus_capsulatus_cf.AAC.2